MKTIGAKSMKKPARILSLPFVKVVQRDSSFHMISLSAADIVALSYVARRGEADEAGAVQRLLNPSRIAGIRDFVLAGGVFPTSIVLNWVNQQPPIEKGLSQSQF
jgi:hypothetical protein